MITRRTFVAALAAVGLIPRGGAIAAGPTKQAAANDPLTATVRINDAVWHITCPNPVKKGDLVFVDDNGVFRKRTSELELAAGEAAADFQPVGDGWHHGYIGVIHQRMI